jgi:hypothetical protein
MFPGHYGPAFAAKRIDPTIPLWILFVAVQFLDIVWAPLVLLGEVCDSSRRLQDPLPLTQKGRGFRSGLFVFPSRKLRSG